MGELSFPERLSDGEKRVLTLRPHWLGVVPPTIATVALLIALAVALGLVPAAWPPFVRVTILAIFGLILLLWPLRRVLAWVTSEYLITNERVVHRAGILTKRSVEIPVVGVADVIFSQNLLQRLAGVGDVVIESAGGLGFTRLAYVDRADDVHRIIYNLMEGTKAATEGSNNSHPATPIDQIEQLASLLERGLLTREEFDTHKTRLLKQL